jgi:hypothetical protein
MVEKNQKYVFLYALIITFVIFNFGIFMGYKLESSRVDKIDEMYIEAELDLLDQRIQREAFEIVGLDCEDSIQANIDFADKIFNEAQKIKKFENANRMNSEILFQHKRFDLLRTLFWMNSIKIKEKCGADYSNVVYFYEYDNPSLEQKAEQSFFSNLLVELKEKHGSKIMLIPIAGDESIPSINLLMKKYEIEELPVILIDEKTKINEVNDKEDIEKYLK